MCVYNTVTMLTDCVCVYSTVTMVTDCVCLQYSKRVQYNNLQFEVHYFTLQYTVKKTDYNLLYVVHSTAIIYSILYRVQFIIYNIIYCIQYSIVYSLKFTV